MAEGKRPGGLTALAVLNFVFAGLGLLSALGLLALLAFANKLTENANPDQRVVFDAFQQLGMGMWAFMLITQVVVIALLVIAGVGYLKTKTWGRKFGTIYALLSIGDAIFTMLALPAVLGGGFSIGTLIGLVYPVLTLILLNTTFKDDFV